MCIHDAMDIPLSYPKILRDGLEPLRTFLLPDAFVDVAKHLLRNLERSFDLRTFFSALRVMQHLHGQRCQQAHHL